jgi:cell division septum initiation protein DivIVA
MSVFEPSTESEHHGPGDVPQFRVAVFGYDRQEVASYVQELSAHLEDERQRAEQAERTIAQMQLEMAAPKSQTATYEHLGVEAAKVLEQAGHSAELLVEEAEGRGRAIVEEARAQAADLVAAAEQRAEQAREDAQRDARRTLNEARDAADRGRREALQEQAEMKAETERLQSLHDSLLKHLGRVRQDLSALLASPEDELRPAADGTEGRTQESAAPGR